MLFSGNEAANLSGFFKNRSRRSKSWIGLQVIGIACSAWLAGCSASEHKGVREHFEVQQNSRMNGTELVEEISSSSEFEKLVLSSQKPILVDFYATWCMPCRRIAPVISGLAKSYSGKVSFYRIDVDKNPGIASSLRIEGIPALKVFKNGVVIEETVGLLSQKDIERLLDRALKQR